MPRKLPPFVSRERTRHGRTAYYFRRQHGKRVRLPDPSDPGFDTAYRAALAGVETEPAKRRRSGPTSLEWLIDQYRKSFAYLALSPATRRQRDNIFKHVIEGAGGAPYAAITRAHIVQGVDRRAGTPAQAGNFIKAMAGLFRWAQESDFVKDNPAAGVKPPQAKSEGFAPWTDSDLEAYRARWPLGTRERLWLEVLLYTGLRRGDVVRIGRQHVRDGVASLKTEKTGVEVFIPVLEPLRKALDAGPTGDLTFICGANGRPLTKESFGNMFREACREAGVTKSAHGVRKIAAAKASEAGATGKELEAMFGWEGAKMPSLYTKSADRRRLAMKGWNR